MREKLKQDQLKELRKLCKNGNSDAIKAYLKYKSDLAQESYNACRDDHRYYQGRMQALVEFLSDIVMSEE